MPIDSAARLRLGRRRTFAARHARAVVSVGAVEAARQFLRALAQTGSSSKGTIGVGSIGYERAFTYVRRGTALRGAAVELWARGDRAAGHRQAGAGPRGLDPCVRRVVVLREVDRQSLLGLYYGHFRAEPGDNGWQLTGRLASEDWESPLAPRARSV